MEQTNSSSDGSTPGSAHEQSRDETDDAVRDRAASLKESLAEALESGADRLRARSSSGAGTQLVTTAGAAVATVVDEVQVIHVTDRVAGGMEATADWIRDADLEGWKTSLERQVKAHPGRALLIAAGIGYLIGKALKK